jgi:carboxyl-terminal processing protease
LLTRAVLCAALSATGTWAQVSARDLASFDQVWQTVRDTHWQKQPGGLDWDAMRAEYRPRVENAATTDEARAATMEMLRRLKQTHFGIVPGTIYSAIEAGGVPLGAGSPGIELRAIGGEAVVTSIEPGSPAERAGVHPGWVVESLKPRPELQELQQARALMAGLTGPVGDVIAVTFVDGDGERVTKRLELDAPRGTITEFGNLPPMPVWYEEKRLGTVGYIRFNAFLDIPRLMPAFEKSVAGCKACSGLIVDLRGNPGGIGGMAMGMAGFLVDKPGQRLGTMYMRDATLNFVVNPRAELFDGPVAVLIDGTSASTAEIFAGGLQDMGRARVFGTRSAAAALPSAFVRLPNGDGFQYAIANYVSANGKALEGEGVHPDEEVRLTRQGLLAGHDAVVDAAIQWIEGVKK